MRMALLCMALVLLCCGSAEVMGQEIIYSPEVLQKQQQVPESVIYGSSCIRPRHSRTTQTNLIGRAETARHIATTWSRNSA